MIGLNKITAISISAILIIALSCNPLVFAAGSKVTVSQLKILDINGNPITSPIQAGNLIQFQANLTNNQNVDQPFAYIVQIKNGVGVTVSLAWITGTLTGGQSAVVALDWTPIYSGTYTAQIFVWKSITSPLQLSNPSTLTFQVQGGQYHAYSKVPVALSGSVNPPFRNNNVILLIDNPSNNLVQIAHAPVANDGTFSTNIIAGGPLFTTTGTYNVQVYYFGVKQNSLSFHCISLSPISCTTP